MLEGLKNNPLACLFLGMVLGGGGTLGIQSVGTTDPPVGVIGSEETYADSTPTPHRKLNNFDRVEYCPDGDVYITKSGSKFHRASCPFLSRPKNMRLVDSAEAKKAGLEPCSKCM